MFIIADIVKVTNSDVDLTDSVDLRSPNGRECLLDESKFSKIIDSEHVKS